MASGHDHYLLPEVQMRHVEEHADVVLSAISFAVRYFSNVRARGLFTAGQRPRQMLHSRMVAIAAPVSPARLPAPIHKADTQRSACRGYPAGRRAAGAAAIRGPVGEGTRGGSMVAAVGRDRFWEMFKGRAVMVAELPAGPSRALATVASESAGRDGAQLRTRADYEALFDLLLTHIPPDPPAKLKLVDKSGQPTAAARAIEDYIGASLGKQEFFDADMYMVHVTGFRPGRSVLTEPRPADGARVDVWKTDPADRRRVAARSGGEALFTSEAFALKNTGNRTLRAPKRSWRIILDAAGHDNRLAEMTRVNLKAMYNDPSQMREALAWRLFRIADVP